MQNDKLKTAASIAYIILFITLAYSALSYVNSYSKSIQPSSFRSFSANGEGKVTAIPDIANFSFEVITEGDKDIGRLQDENSKKVNSAIDFIKSEGIKDEDIKTQAYNINPRYQYSACGVSLPISSSQRCPPPEIVGYTINQSVSVKIRDFDKIGDLLSGVTKKGANSVSQLAFTIDDPSELQNQARAEAIRKAMKNAEATAKAAGVKLGRLLYINDAYNPQPYFGTALGKGVGGDFIESSAIAPSIEPGSQEIIISVSLQFEIE